MAFERPQRRLGGGQAQRFQPRGGAVGNPPVTRQRQFTRPSAVGPSQQAGPQSGLGTAAFAPPSNNRFSPEQALTHWSERYSRPMPALQVILRTLAIPENIIAGFAEGVAGGLDDGDMPPWAYVKALGLGFTEIPSAVRENQTWEEFLLERTDPESFWHRNASTIGLGMSVFFDPTMYLTFGATGASRIAAKQILSQGWQRSADEAVQYMSNGMKHPATGRMYSPKDDIDEVMAEIHLGYNSLNPGSRPFTMGDALDQLRKTDRSGTAGIYRQIFARGGRGTRFAGHELPGTRRAGEAVASTFRNHTSEVLSMKGSASFMARAFVPDAKLKVIAQDARRAIALTEFRNIEAEAKAFGEKVTKQAAAIAKIDNPVARGVATMFGRSVDYVPQAERRGILKGKNPGNPQAQRMVNLANLRKAEVIKEARSAGLDNKQLGEINDLWDHLVRRYDDPVEVVSHFLMRTSARVMAAKQIDNVLSNPMMARRLDSKMVDEAVEHHEWIEKPGADITTLLGGRDPLMGPMHAIPDDALLDLTKSSRELRKTGESPKVKEGTVIASLEDYERIIKQKARPFKWRGKEYAVSDAVYDALDNIKNPAFIDHEMSKLFRGMNGIQNLWKIPATVLNPAFHSMNLVGGAWNNMLAGPYGPIDYIESWARIMMRRINAGEAGVVGKGALAASKPLLRRRNLDDEANEALMTAFDAGGGGGRSGLISAEISMGMARDLARQAGDRPMLPRFRGGFDTGRAFTAARRTFAGLGAAEIGTNVAASQGWIDDFDIPGGNEFAAVVLGLPEAARVGRFTASYVEETLRLTPFNETYKDKSVQQLLEATGPIRVNNFAKTAPPGLTKRQQKAVFDIGTEMAIHFQFDYTKLTDIERQFAKTVFPFWTFYKNNFMLQTREIITRPRFVQGFYHMANYVEEEFGEEISPEMEQMLPEYFSNLGAFQLPVPAWGRDFLGLPQDVPLYLNPKLPFLSLNLFPPFWELFNERSQTPFYQRALQVAAPIAGSVGPFAAAPVPGAKLWFESVTGTNLGLARPIDFQRASSNDWRESYTPAPGYFRYLPKTVQQLFGAVESVETGELVMHPTTKYITDTMSTPFISNYGKVVPTSYDGARRDKAKADMVAWMIGLRLMPVDTLKISRSWAYRMESGLEAKRAELREQGFELEPEDEMLLKQTRRTIKEIEAQWDVRERELFG